MTRLRPTSRSLWQRRRSSKGPSRTLYPWRDLRMFMETVLTYQDFWNIVGRAGSTLVDTLGSVLPAQTRRDGRSSATCPRCSSLGRTDERSSGCGWLGARVAEGPVREDDEIHLLRDGFGRTRGGHHGSPRPRPGRDGSKRPFLAIPRMVACW